MQEIDQTLQEFNSQKKLSQVCNDFFNFLKGDFIDTTDTINYQKQNYNYTIVRQITTIEEDENSNLQTYIIASFDLGKVEKIPNKTFLANLSRSVYEKYIFVPFVIVFRYRVNEQNYLTFSISQIRDKTNQRTGKTKTTKVILLKDINLEKPHPAHSKILEKLKNETTAVKNFDELHENWLKVLNIKELGDEFYKKILEKYNDLVEKIILPTHTNPSENDKKDFALKLVGRLIFCWFLKAKGWVSEDILGSKIVEAEFIRQNEISFYHQILEPLFFESLNKDPQTRDFENKEKFASVPYLNGGLFEATEKDFYDSNLKDTDKRTNWKLEIPNQNLKEIFELFESYYFTIDENTSTEQEIGVDPEMMGRIFENFILNRSSTGSFYTPREIVDYMVETSLLEFMETKINYVDLTIDYFLELTKKDDHTLTGILENYPKRRFITKIKDNNFEISFYLLAKLRGWHLINDKITRISHRHIEIDYGFWSSFFGQNFEIETYFFAKSKDVFIHKIQVKIPKIGIIISINELKYVLILSFSSAGFWIIDTCYQLFGNKSEKLKKEAKKNLEELKHFWTNKNIPQGDIGFFEVDGYYHRAHSERQLSEIFTVFQRIYSKIINKEKNLVKFFSANKIQKFLDGVFCNTKKSLEKDKKQQIIQTLNSLKILDPACGSGAFPMGVLQKLTEIRKSLGEVYSQEDKERIEKSEERDRKNEKRERERERERKKRE